MEQNIEVEVRSFVDKKKYDELLKFFQKNAEQTKEDYQETFYFDKEGNFRLQRANLYSKLWFKGGKMHDEAREELEIKVDRDDFDKLERLFRNLGHDIQVKWFRDRKVFDWNGIKVCMDHTKGYGYIIELEKMSNEQSKDKVYAELKKLLENDLGTPLTPKAEFDKAYKNYMENWKSLI